MWAQESWGWSILLCSGHVIQNICSPVTCKIVFCCQNLSAYTYCIYTLSLSRIGIVLRVHIEYILSKLAEDVTHVVKQALGLNLGWDISCPD